MTTILHITDQLGIGGAEILLKNTLPALQEYRHVVVYLGGSTVLKPSLDQYPVYCIDHRGKSSFLRSVFRLKKIIKEQKVDSIHAHLFWSSIIARLARPRAVRLITTLHSVLSKDAFEKNRLSLWAERITANRQDDIIGVSEYAIKDYLGHIRYKNRTHVLYNFIPDIFFEQGRTKEPGLAKNRPVRCIAVGNLKEVKNYQFILNAFAQLPHGDFELDIAGEGDLRPSMEFFIDAKNLPVKLLGSRNNLAELLPAYDVFIQASSFEGFGIAMAEAIAVGLIPVLSDIPVHREVTDGKALYFSLSDPGQLAAELLNLLHHQYNSDMMTACRNHIRSISSPGIYFKKLREIYNN